MSEAVDFEGVEAPVFTFFEPVADKITLDGITASSIKMGFACAAFHISKIRCAASNIDRTDSVMNIGRSLKDKPVTALHNAVRIFSRHMKSSTYPSAEELAPEVLEKLRPPLLLPKRWVLRFFSSPLIDFGVPIVRSVFLRINSIIGFVEGSAVAGPSSL